jgi:uncharacterized membrane protein (UPF0127 family)
VKLLSAVREKSKRVRSFAIVLLVSSCSACERSPAWTSPIPFDTATAWIHTASDSVSLLVEVADSRAEINFGLMDRPSLSAGSGMVFEFDSVQAGDAGFWMYRTRMPLDIAFMDSAGAFVSILQMEPCEFQIQSSLCPSYEPEHEYWSALEVNRGWFQQNGIGPGARIRLERGPMR